MSVFQKTRYQLLVSYLTVFALILGIFALAIRVAFTRSISRQNTDKLWLLGLNAASDTEFDRGRLQVEDDFFTQDVMTRYQAVQWFDTQGNLVLQEGNYVLNLPLDTDEQPIREILAKYCNRAVKRPNVETAEKCFTTFRRGVSKRLFSTFWKRPEVQVEKQGSVYIRGVIVPITSRDGKRLVGYVRASQSLEEIDDTLDKLDWGLGSSVAIALVLSGVGGVWLTRQAMQPIERSFQRLKQFTGDASHELRSPLMAITTNVKVALKYPEGMRPSDAEKFKAIASAANQMTRLTEDLLLLARSDRGLTLRRETVNVEEILDNLLELNQAQAEAKSINVKANLTKGLSVLGDSVQLTRVFGNLIENALHYTPVGGTVEIETELVGQQLYVKVKDTGIGIAPEQLPHIFERFWRADEARSYRSGGSGLGLAIAQTFVQNHRGLITATSQLGVGSCFTVRLPAGASTPKPE